MHIEKHSYTVLLYIFLTSESSEKKHSAYDGLKHDHHEGGVALSARDEPTLGGMPLLKLHWLVGQTCWDKFSNHFGLSSNPMGHEMHV